MFSNDSTMQQRPVLYVLVQGQQGQNGNTSAPARAVQVQQQPPHYHLQKDLQLEHYRSSQGQNLQQWQPQPVTKTSHAGHPFTVPSLGPTRRGSNQRGTRNQGTPSTALRPPSAEERQRRPSSPPRRQHSPPIGSHQSHHENVEIISIPQYAYSNQQQQFQQQYTSGGQVAFPPPGATIQMITHQGVPQPRQQSSMFAHYQSQPHQVPSFQNAIRMPVTYPIERNVMGNLTMSVTPHQQQQQQPPQQQQQQHGLIPIATPIYTSAQPTSVALQDVQTTAPVRPPIDPSIKFLHAPPGVTIPPQPFPSYQLVPAGYQVVPITKVDKSEAETFRQQLDLNSLEVQGGTEQQEDDQEEDEERLLREPIVLSGTPYNYPVNIGKDVVSGKGGRAQQYNRHFRRLITEAYPRYNETGSKIEKREIGIRIYLTIVKGGGRFLDADGHPMNRSKAILKVMKALKDAKTWANDDRRMAYKRRKEARQRMRREALGRDRGDADSPKGNGDDGHDDADDDDDDDDDLYEGSEVDDEIMKDEDDLSDEADDLETPASEEKSLVVPSQGSIPVAVDGPVTNNNDAQGAVVLQGMKSADKISSEQTPPSAIPSSAENPGGDASDDEAPTIPTATPGTAQTLEKETKSLVSLPAAKSGAFNSLKSRLLPMALPKQQIQSKASP